MTGQYIVGIIGEHIPIVGADRIVQTNLYGEILIVDKTLSPPGTRGILIDCESEVSFEVAKYLNLHRHSNLNENPEEIGYLEDTRRIRPIRLKGVKCSALFLSFDALKHIPELSNFDFNALPLGMQDNSINGVDICKKYVIQRKASNNVNYVKVINVPTFKEHFDTDQLGRNLHMLTNNSVVTVTTKLHGTSVRCANLPILRKKSWLEKLVNRFGFETPESKYGFVVGSRRVVKYVDYNEKVNDNISHAAAWTTRGWKFVERMIRQAYSDIHGTFISDDELESMFYGVDRTQKPTVDFMYILNDKFAFKTDTGGMFIDWYKRQKLSTHFYSSDIWTNVATTNFKDRLNKGESVYFELVGYDDNDALIMPQHNTEKLKNFMDKAAYNEFYNKYGPAIAYTYGCVQGVPEKRSKIYVYRITQTNADGESIDLSWEQVKFRCEQLNVDHVPEIARFIWPVSKDATELFDQILEDVYNERPDHIHEGICVRIDTGKPTTTILKAKHYYFKVLEGIEKDNANVVNIEEIN